MKLHNVKMPENWYRGYEDAELESWDLECIPEHVKEAWYWYGTAPYEGSGQMVVQYENGTWDLYNLSHCSCYGPTNEQNWETPEYEGYESLEALKEKCHEDFYEKELKMIFEEICK